LVLETGTALRDEHAHPPNRLPKTSNIQEQVLPKRYEDQQTIKGNRRFSLADKSTKREEKDENKRFEERDETS
jgi:hypothetical protein